MIKLDHFYIYVTDLDKAISFYQKILCSKVNHREGDRWADFDSGDGIYFGIFNVDESYKVGDNITIALKTDDIKLEYERIKSLAPKEITDIIHLTEPYSYFYFQFKDEWGNNWEVAQYA